MCSTCVRPVFGRTQVEHKSNTSRTNSQTQFEQQSCSKCVRHVFDMCSTYVRLAFDLCSSCARLVLCLCFTFLNLIWLRVSNVSCFFVRCQLYVIQMGGWVMRELSTTPTLDGHGYAGVSCHWRYLGRPAASGARRIIFTCQSVHDAERVMLIVSKWWAPDTILEQGWRWCNVRWFMPRTQD